MNNTTYRKIQRFQNSIQRYIYAQMGKHTAIPLPCDKEGWQFTITNKSNVQHCICQTSLLYTLQDTWRRKCLINYRSYLHNY